MSFKEDCKKYGVVLEGRWEAGTDHHPEANAQLQEAFALDFQEYNDYFCWNVGGDGDNGEALIEQYSIILELRDAKLKEKYPNAFDKVRELSEKNDVSLLESALSIMEGDK